MTRGQRLALLLGLIAALVGVALMFMPLRATSGRIAYTCGSVATPMRAPERWADACRDERSRRLTRAVAVVVGGVVVGGAGLVLYRERLF